MRRLKTVRRPPIYPKTPGHLPYSLTHPLPLSSRRPSVSFGGFGLSGTSGLVIDQVTGDMIVSDDFPGIHKVDTNGNVTPLATNFTFQNPNGLDLDGSGRLLVADSGDRILRVTLNPNGSAGVVETLATGFSIPQGVVETSGGDVLFSPNPPREGVWLAS